MSKDFRIEKSGNFNCRSRGNLPVVHQRGLKYGQRDLFRLPQTKLRQEYPGQLAYAKLYAPAREYTVSSQNKCDGIGTLRWSYLLSENSMPSQRPHTKTGIASLGPAFLIAFGLLALARCDSGFVPEPASTESDPVEHVRRWYEEAIARTQEERLGKFSNAEIMAAMVAKYPPDWSQAVSISHPSQDDITRVTTLLGPGQPTTTHSHAALGVVRTISVDVNPNDEVVGSR